MKLLRKKIYLVPAKGSRRAFSLVELLVVMGIVVLLGSLSTGALRSVVMGAPLERSLTGISSAMEVARQTAIAGGSYTWVALAQNKDAMGNNQVTVVVFASKDGNLDAASGGRKKFRLVDHLQVYPNIIISEDAPNANVTQQLPTNCTLVASLKESGFRPRPSDLALPNSAQELNFERVIMFTPTGEAVIDNTSYKSGAEIPLQQALKLTVTPSRGTSPNATERKSASIVWINGITGAITIFQPQAS